MEINNNITFEMKLEKIMEMYTPLCIANLSQEMDEIYWIKKEFVEELTQQLKKAGDQKKFIPILQKRKAELERQKAILVKNGNTKGNTKINVQLEILQILLEK